MLVVVMVCFATGWADPMFTFPTLTVLHRLHKVMKSSHCTHLVGRRTARVGSSQYFVYSENEKGKRVFEELMHHAQRSPRGEP